MLLKELITIGVCLVAGLILALIAPLTALGGWKYLLVPVYILGITYGASTVIPWIGKMIASMSKMFMFSVIMKSIVGVILMLVLLPVFLLVLLTVGWVIGMVKLAGHLTQSIQEEQFRLSPRKRLREDWEQDRSSRREEDDRYRFNDDDDDGFGQEQLGDGGAYPEENYSSNYGFDDNGDY